MFQQESAIRQIDEIYAILKGNLKTMLSPSLLIVTGVSILSIPLIELIFDNTIDIYLVHATAHATAMAFAIRTIFYWTFFSIISRYFKKSEGNNLIRSQLFGIGQWFPLIPIATGGALGVTGNGDLAMPVVLILVGTLFIFFGQFSSVIVSKIAWSIVATGIVGICLTSYAIAYLWIYMLAYLGLSFIVMGCFLHYEQNSITDRR